MFSNINHCIFIYSYLYLFNMFKRFNLPHIINMLYVTHQLIISRQPSLFNHQDPTISPSNHKNYKYQAAARQPREFFFNPSMWMIIRKYCVIFLIISYKNIERPTPYPSSIEQEKRHSGHSKSTDVRGQLSLPAQDLGNFPRPLARGSQSARRRSRDWW